jgi:hypothetical protein
MKKLFFILLILPAIGFSQTNCDSIFVEFDQIDSTHSPARVDFDYETTFSSSSTWYGYAGFVLTTNSGDTIAYETLETSNSHFGFGGSMSESRNMVLLEDIELPFTGQIKVMDGWFAGGKTEACSIPFTIPETVLALDDEVEIERTLLKITDELGRSVTKSIGKVQFYHYSGGVTEKVIVTE